MIQNNFSDFLKERAPKYLNYIQAICYPVSLIAGYFIAMPDDVISYCAWISLSLLAAISLLMPLSLVIIYVYAKPMENATVSPLALIGKRTKAQKFIQKLADVGISYEADFLTLLFVPLIISWNDLFNSYEDTENPDSYRITCANLFSFILKLPIYIVVNSIFILIWLFIITLELGIITCIVFIFCLIVSAFTRFDITCLLAPFEYIWECYFSIIGWLWDLIKKT